MSLKFPRTQNWKVINDGETEPVGSFSSTSNGELTNVTLPLLKIGTLAGTEQVRLKLFHDAALTQLYATSQWRPLSGNVAASAPWRGTIRFDFSGEFISSSQSYHVAVETQGYTRNGETLYLAAGLNSPVASVAGNVNLGASMAIYQKRGVRY